MHVNNLDTENLLSEQSHPAHEHDEKTESGRKITNQQILMVTAILFGGFVIAEIIGALASNSLALLGDAAAMSVDVFTYLCNMYAEYRKAKDGVLTDNTRRILEVYVPSISVTALIGVTTWILSDAIAIIKDNGHDSEDVNVYFLWAFSVVSVFVDLFSSLMFYSRGKDVLVTHRDHAPLRTFSLDRRSIDMGKRSIIPVPNLNMISALTHVGGDTLRTISVFVAALVSTAFNQSGTLCDAWASVVVSFSIFICMIPLCKEIYNAAFYPPGGNEDSV